MQTAIKIGVLVALLYLMALPFVNSRAKQAYDAHQEQFQDSLTHRNDVLTDVYKKAPDEGDFNPYTTPEYVAAENQVQALIHSHPINPDELIDREVKVGLYAAGIYAALLIGLSLRRRAK